MVDEPGVAGCDEAGRGPLAGPVVCAAVVLPRGHGITGLGDSKRLSTATRDSLYGEIVSIADYCVVEVSASEVDDTDVLRASLNGMARAVAGLAATPERVVVDGNRVPDDIACRCEAWVKGDSRHAAIAAASILAKVTRDRVMVRLAAEFPGYGFERNFGYPTPDHLVALRRLGPCPAHRVTFAPVRDVVNQPALF